MDLTINLFSVTTNLETINHLVLDCHSREAVNVTMTAGFSEIRLCPNYAHQTSALQYIYSFKGQENIIKENTFKLRRTAIHANLNRDSLVVNHVLECQVWIRKRASL